MKILITIAVLAFTSLTIQAQLCFDVSKISDSTLNCIDQIDLVTANPDFDRIDSLRAKYSHLIWMDMPYATNAELFELTNYKNKWVRIHAFDLLLSMGRDSTKTVLQILEKNVSDTLEYIEVFEGCFLDSVNIFQHILDKTNKTVEYYDYYEKRSYFPAHEKDRWLALKKLIVKPS